MTKAAIRRVRRLCMVSSVRRNGVPPPLILPCSWSSRRRLSDVDQRLQRERRILRRVRPRRGPEHDSRRAPRTAYRAPMRPSDGSGTVTLSRHQSSAARAVRCEIERGIGPIRVTANRCSHRSKLRLKLCCALAIVAPFGFSSTASSKSMRTDRPSCSRSSTGPAMNPSPEARTCSASDTARTVSVWARQPAAASVTSSDREQSRRSRTRPPAAGSKPHPHHERDAEVIGVQRKRERHEGVVASARRSRSTGGTASLRCGSTPSRCRGTAPMPW